MFVAFTSGDGLSLLHACFWIPAFLDTERYSRHFLRFPGSAPRLLLQPDKRIAAHRQNPDGAAVETATQNRDRGVVRLDNADYESSFT